MLVYLCSARSYGRSRHCISMYRTYSRQSNISCSWSDRLKKTPLHGKRQFMPSTERSNLYACILIYPRVYFSTDPSSVSRTGLRGGGGGGGGGGGRFKRAGEGTVIW